ncbi:Sporulation kinase A [BD1-7 clade bacterium]|uniref:histidine kinase n=1 Tax=BD1-7 clade bacterium TaxID=2029982 RepID=A0A5S9QYS1_9GAMM|nr:Sporulation kinase A [BD1-7 clade bacterium]
MNAGTREDKRLIIFYAYFRICLAAMVLLASFASRKQALSEYDNNSFWIAGGAFLLCTVLHLIAFHADDYRRKNHSVAIAIMVDIGFILALVHLSGGLATGLAILLIIPISISAIFFSGNTATIYAALASLGILGDSIWFDLSDAHDTSYLVPSGILGMVFFVISIGLQFLSNRIRQAQQQAQHLLIKADTLSELNKEIVQRIRTGVMIFDSNGDLKLSNNAAEKLLLENEDTNKIEQQLRELIHRWLNDSKQNHYQLKGMLGKHDVQINFSNIGDGDHIIAFIDDMTEIAQQALQLKLASLGRLTASIAHEIRNPLSAINHSVQLLAESPALTDSADQRLFSIVNNHVGRINEIITNIQSMSQNKSVRPERLNIKSIIEQIQDEYQTKDANCIFEIDSSDGKESGYEAPFDASQLRQVLTNLIDNALRYSNQHTGIPWVGISFRKDSDSVVLDVSDKGQGVPENSIAQLFEPFFTTESTGTGLGLYISRELCTLNQSQLTYTQTEVGHSFRLKFAHADRDIDIRTNDNKKT